jgi:hypothetical protein
MSHATADRAKLHLIPCERHALALAAEIRMANEIDRAQECGELATRET